MLTMGLGGGVSIQAQGWVWGASGKPGGCKGGGGPAKGLLGSSGQCFLQAPGTASQAAPPYPPACLHSTSLHPWPGAISEAEGPAGATGAWLILMRGPQPKAPACSWSSFTWGRMTSRCCDWPRTCSLRHCLVPGNPAWLHRWLLPGLPRPAPPRPAPPRPAQSRPAPDAFSLEGPWRWGRPELHPPGTPSQPGSSGRPRLTSLGSWSEALPGLLAPVTWH